MPNEEDGGRKVIVGAEVTELEAAEIKRMALLLGVNFSIMAGAAVRRGLEKIENETR